MYVLIVVSGHRATGKTTLVLTVVTADSVSIRNCTRFVFALAYKAFSSCSIQLKP